MQKTPKAMSRKRKAALIIEFPQQSHFGKGILGNRKTSLYKNFKRQIMQHYRLEIKFQGKQKCMDKTERLAKLEYIFRTPPPSKKTLSVAPETPAVQETQLQQAFEDSVRFSLLTPKMDLSSQLSLQIIDTQSEAEISTLKSIEEEKSNWIELTGEVESESIQQTPLILANSPTSPNPLILPNSPSAPSADFSTPQICRISKMQEESFLDESTVLTTRSTSCIMETQVAPLNSSILFGKEQSMDHHTAIESSLDSQATLPNTQNSQVNNMSSSQEAMFKRKVRFVCESEDENSVKMPKLVDEELNESKDSPKESNFVEMNELEDFEKKNEFIVETYETEDSGKKSELIVQVNESKDYPKEYNLNVETNETEDSEKKNNLIVDNLAVESIAENIMYSSTIRDEPIIENPDSTDIKDHQISASDEYKADISFNAKDKSLVQETETIPKEIHHQQLQLVWAKEASSGMFQIAQIIRKASKTREVYSVKFLKTKNECSLSINDFKAVNLVPGDAVYAKRSSNYSLCTIASEVEKMKVMADFKGSCGSSISVPVRNLALDSKMYRELKQKSFSFVPEPKQETKNEIDQQTFDTKSDVKSIENTTASSFRSDEKAIAPSIRSDEKGFGIFKGIKFCITCVELEDDDDSNSGMSLIIF